MRMMRKFLLILLVLSFSGCSFISYRTDQTGRKSKPIPVKPQISRRLQETIRKEAQLTYDSAVKIYNDGSEPKSLEARILLRASDKILTFTGKPAIPVELPESEGEAEKEVNKLHAEFEKQVNESRDLERGWEDEIMALKAERQALAEDRDRWRVSFGNLKFYFWVLVIGTVGLCILFPSLIPVIVKWAKKGVSAILTVTRRQMKEVISAVQKIRQDDTIPEDVKKKIDAHLVAGQSTDTQVEIAKIKKGEWVGIVAGRTDWKGG